jgi:hypothetical protein
VAWQGYKKMEFINNNITDRKKLLKHSSFVLVPLLVTFFAKYFFASKEVQEGIKHSRRMFSLNEFLFFSIGAVIVFVISTIASRIYLRIMVSEENKTLSIDVIEKFKVLPKIYVIKLSETQISHSETETKGKMYYSLILNTKSYGEFHIQELHFVDIKVLIDYFEGLKLINAQQLRQKRLITSRRRR